MANDGLSPCPNKSQSLFGIPRIEEELVDG